VRNIAAERNALAADFTFCHIYTSNSAIFNATAQLYHRFQGIAIVFSAFLRKKQKNFEAFRLFFRAFFLLRIRTLFAPVDFGSKSRLRISSLFIMYIRAAARFFGFACVFRGRREEKTRKKPLKFTKRRLLLIKPHLQITVFGV